MLCYARRGSAGQGGRRGGGGARSDEHRGARPRQPDACAGGDRTAPHRVASHRTAPHRIASCCAASRRIAHLSASSRSRSSCRSSPPPTLARSSSPSHRGLTLRRGPRVRSTSSYPVSGTSRSLPPSLPLSLWHALQHDACVAGVAALLDMGLPGEQEGHALADVLFGDVNPSARLPHTMPNRWNEVGMSADQYPGMPPDVHSGGPPACGFTPDPNPPGPGFAPCVPTKARGHSVAPRAWLDRSVAAVGPMMPHDAMRCPMCVCHRRTTPRSCRSATDGTRSRA